MTSTNRVDKPSTASIGLKSMLWIAQFVVGAVFIAAGSAKLTMPIPDLAKMMAWTGQLPLPFVRSIGLLDIAGGLGILLPALTRIKPQLTTYAAAGCSILQVCAIVFHLSRGEGALIPLNLVLLPLALFVWWGRSRRAPIAPRL